MNITLVKLDKSYFRYVVWSRSSKTSSSPFLQLGFNSPTRLVLVLQSIKLRKAYNFTLKMNTGVKLGAIISAFNVE